MHPWFLYVNGHYDDKLSYIYIYVCMVVGVAAYFGSEIEAIPSSIIINILAVKHRQKGMVVILCVCVCKILGKLRTLVAPTREKSTPMTTLWCPAFSNHG